MSSVADYFDVLSIEGNNEKVDIIQSLIGTDCLGTYFENGTAQLYFNGGNKDRIELQLHNINAGLNFNWRWNKQLKEDWHLAWQDNFTPVIIEKKLAIVPHWQNDISADIVIKIKPGMAFGTGHHETTWLMLNQILKHIKPGMSILDLGAGSGILSIAAIKLGAEKVDAVEFDSDCESNFNENLQLNHIEKHIHFITFGPNHIYVLARNYTKTHIAFSTSLRTPWKVILPQMSLSGKSYYLRYASASSNGVRFSRCKFSTKAISRASWSVNARITTGTSCC